MVAFGSPSPSVPITTAFLSCLFSSGASSGRELSSSAMARVAKPSALSSPTGSWLQVQGTRNTVPIETLTARRLSGSQESSLSTTASTPKAAAERKMAPMLVVSVTPWITHTFLALRHVSSSAGLGLRRMAQSTPRVSR